MAVYLGHHYTISTSHVNVIGASCDLVDAFMDSYHSKFTSVNVARRHKMQFPVVLRAIYHGKNTLCNRTLTESNYVCVQSKMSFTASKIQG